MVGHEEVSTWRSQVVGTNLGLSWEVLFATAFIQTDSDLFMNKLKNKIKTSCLGQKFCCPAPTPFLKSSNDGTVIMEAGRVFQRRIAEGKKEACRQRLSNMEPVFIVSSICAGMDEILSAGIFTRLLTMRYIIMSCSVCDVIWDLPNIDSVAWMWNCWFGSNHFCSILLHVSGWLQPCWCWSGLVGPRM